VLVAEYQAELADDIADRLQDQGIAADVTYRPAPGSSLHVRPRL
jgi:hypothetical protein